LNAFFVAGKSILIKWGIDQSVVIIGNLVLFIVSLISFSLCRRSLRSDNPNVFVRAMYASVMLRLFVCIVAAFIYFTAAKKNINKPGLFVCMGLYVVYTVIEVSSLTKLLRKKKNA
jgi:small-conductance mechanosensitive channel